LANAQGGFDLLNNNLTRVVGLLSGFQSDLSQIYNQGSCFWIGNAFRNAEYAACNSA